MEGTRAGRSVLLLLADHAEATLAADALRGAGIRAVVAHDIEAAFAALLSTQCGCAVIDCALPTHRLRELAARTGSYLRLGRIPVVLVGADVIDLGFRRQVRVDRPLAAVPIVDAVEVCLQMAAAEPTKVAL